MIERLDGEIGMHASPASAIARIAAGAIGLVAATGLLIQARSAYAEVGLIPATLWILAGFFTIIANLLVAVLFARVAAGGRVTSRWLAGTTLAIMLVGIVYALLLHGLLVLSGGAVLANALLHYATPMLAPLWWLGFAPKGTLRRGDQWRWVILPLAYLPWALARGAATGRFAYSFLDFRRHGWPWVSLVCAIIAAGFIAASFALLALDRALGRRAGR